MAPKRGNASRRRRDALRFVLIAPKRTRALEFSDRLLQGGAAGKAPGLRGTGLSRARPVPNLTFLRRLAASLIAALWTCAGLAAAASGVREGGWLASVLGAASLLYGIGWFQAAFRGRMAGGRLHLNPWRVE